MVTFTITLPDTIKVARGKDTGNFDLVPIKDFPESTIKFAAIAGFEGALGNIAEPKDENGRKLGDDAWASMRAKRMKPWLEGTAWASRTREGGNETKEVKEAFLAHFAAQAKLPSMNAAETRLKALVKKALGDDAPANVDNMFRAIATAKGMTGDELEAYVDGRWEHYESEVAKRRAKAKDLVDELDFSAIDI